MSHLRWLSIGLFMLLLSSVTASHCLAATVNVTVGQSIQAAINAATFGTEIVVGVGTYHERLDFKGKGITVRSTAPTNPSVVAATIVNADAGGPVVSFKTAEGRTAVLDGLTLTNGTGVETGWGIAGGGVFCWYTSPTVRNCLIRNNTATYGGGMYTGTGSPLFNGNTVRNNASFNGAGIAISYSTPTINGNTVYSNNATSSGGGIIVSYSRVTLTNNVIYLNTAPGGGGGIAMGEWPIPAATSTVTGNVIVSNSSGTEGGGVACWNVTVSLLNNTISGNKALHGAGVYVGNSSVNLANNIITSGLGGGGVYVGAGAAPTVAYCDVYGNAGGNYLLMPDQTGAHGNLSKDPLFADVASRNFRLKSAGGRFVDLTSSWLNDTVTSPCIDAGNPASPFGNEFPPNGSRVNMGYDGNTAQASKTPALTVVAWSPTGTTVPVTSNLTATFSVSMTRTSANKALTINGVKASAFGGAFSWSGNKLTFNPTRNLTAGTSYKIVIGLGARSAAGAPLATAFTWTFKTAVAAPVSLTASAAPTASGAQIMLSLSSEAEVCVSIRNLAGREVAVLRPGTLEAGMHSLLWSGKSQTGTKCPAGTYLIQVSAQGSDGAICSAMTSLRR